MSWLTSPFILLVPFAYLAWRSPRWASVVLAGLLPTYLWRTSVWGVPTTWLELGIYITALAALINWGVAPWRQLFVRQNAIWIAPVALWLMAAIVSCLVAPDSRLALGQLKGWILDPLIFVGTVAVVARQGDHQNLVRDMLGALLWSATVTVVVGLTTFSLNHDGRLAAWYDSPNVLAMFLLPIGAAAFTWYVEEGRVHLKSSAKIWWLVGCVVVLIGLLLTNSFAGVFALAAALASWGLMKYSRSTKLRTALAVALVTAGLLLPVLTVGFGRWILPSHANSAYQLTSGEVRTVLWRESVLKISKHPVLGIGLGQWQPQFLSELKPGLPGALNPGYLIELYYASLFPHNLWLTTWLSLGLAGLLVLAWLSVKVLRAGVRSAVPAVAMVAILTQGIVDTPLYKNDLSVLFWLCVLAAAALRYNDSPA